MKDRKPDQLEPTPSHRQSRCPTCHRIFSLPGEEVPLSRTPFPFCSERCKLVDLGAWLDTKYRIPSGPDEDSEDMMSGPLDNPENTP